MLVAEIYNYFKGIKMTGEYFVRDLSYDSDLATDVTNVASASYTKARSDRPDLSQIWVSWAVVHSVLSSSRVNFRPRERQFGIGLSQSGANGRDK